MAEPETLRTLIAGVEGCPPDTRDWDDLMGLANRTLTTGTLAEAMRHWPESAPSEVTAFLSTLRERATRRTLQLSKQLNEAVSLLNRAGIRPMPFKGATMLCDPWRAAAAGRLLSDLDIIVPQAAMADAERRLRAAGYMRQDPTTTPPNPIVLWRERDVGAIDLHCGIKAREVSRNFDELVPYCVRHELDTGTVWLPSPTLQAVMLIAHDQLQDRDYWRGHVDLRHLLDLKLLAATGDGIDWALLSAFFPEGYPHRALQTQLITLARLANVAMPRAVTAPLWPRLQFHRRVLQMRWPVLALPLTILTLALDPPRREAPGQAVGNGHRRVGSWLEMLQRRFLRGREVGKI